MAGGHQPDVGDGPGCPPSSGSGVKHSKMQRDEPGVKFDAGKSRIDLIPPSFIEGVGQVLAFGAAKYGERNFEKGMSWGRIYGGMMRHSLAFWRGEENDAETGLPHIWHLGGVRRDALVSRREQRRQRRSQQGEDLMKFIFQSDIVMGAQVTDRVSGFTGRVAGFYVYPKSARVLVVSNTRYQGKPVEEVFDFTRLDVDQNVPPIEV